MIRKWGVTGVGGLESHSISLPEEMRQQIRLEVAGANKSPKSGFAPVFLELETAIRHFRVIREWARSGSPGRVRGNLTRLRDDALRLNESFNSLDANSSQLLANYADVNWLKGECLHSIINTALKALEEAQKLPARGRLPEDEKIVLVLEVAEILSQHLKIKFSSTKVSVFSNIMILVLQVATDKGEIHSISRLLKKARNWRRRVTADGVVSFEQENVT